MSTDRSVEGLLAALSPYIVDHKKANLIARPMYGKNRRCEAIQVEVLMASVPGASAPLMQFPLSEEVKGAYDRDPVILRVIYAVVLFMVVGSAVGVGAALALVFYKATLHVFSISS